MKGYKLLQKTQDGQLASFNQDDIGEVIYQVGKRAYPVENCGPLCVLTSRDEALDHLKYYGVVDVAVYECEFAPSKKRTVFTEDKKKHWKYSANLQQLRFNFWSTRLAEWVKITKLVGEV